MASGSGVNFSSALILIFSEVIAADNTYAVSITTTEPGAPQSLTATNVTSTGVTLNWSAPNSIGGSAITGYKYRYKASGALIVRRLDRDIQQRQPDEPPWSRGLNRPPSTRSRYLRRTIRATASIPTRLRPPRFGAYRRRSWSSTAIASAKTAT